MADSVEQALVSLPEDTDAVYVTPMLRLGETAIRRLGDALIERGLPSFSLPWSPDSLPWTLASLKEVIDEHDDANGGDSVPYLCSGEYDFYAYTDDDGGNANDSRPHFGFQSLGCVAF